MSPLLSPLERRLFQKLSTPGRIQDYLDSLPINFELSGETYFSPRRTVREGTAHCFEGALFAAAVLAWHGQEPLLLDLKTAAPDTDHVVALFRRGRFWGAISKTNHPVLRWRDPIYASVRELAMSYFHEYFLSPSGVKTLRSFSKPFSLARYQPERWLTAEEDLDWLVEALDQSPHTQIVEGVALRSLRKASKIEVQASDLTEWREI
ncbi:hypothetical protein FJY94_04180 [Candidatus Kaiserbacteria bacterium]|nr:hypothetical protein [Candidatus Kaiserbacteria bacterium]